MERRPRGRQPGQEAAFVAIVGLFEHGRRIMMGRQTVIRGGLVLASQGRAALQDVLIDSGRIVAIENPGFDVSDDAESGFPT